MKNLTKRITALFLSGILICSGISAFAIQPDYAAVANLRPVITTINKDAYGVLMETNIYYIEPYCESGVRVFRSVNGKDWVERSQKSPRQIYAVDDGHGYYEIADKTVKNGNIYQYKVIRTFEGRDIKTSKPSDYVAFFNVVDREKIVIKNIDNDTTMKISWERNPKADGYQIMYSTQKHGWEKKDQKFRTVKGSKTTTVKLKNRTPGKQYKVKICPYKVFKGKKYYGTWCGNVRRYPDRGWK